MEFRVNLRGPPRKAKYSSMTDSETVLRRKDEKEPLARSEKIMKPYAYKQLKINKD